MVEVIKAEDIPNLGDYDIDIYNAIIVPKGATNGDMIKAMFPNTEFKNDHDFTIWGYINNGDCVARYGIDWWNAPYKRGNENGKVC